MSKKKEWNEKQTWFNCRGCGKITRSAYPTTNIGRGMTLRERAEFKKKRFCVRCGISEYKRKLARDKRDKEENKIKAMDLKIKSDVMDLIKIKKGEFTKLVPRLEYAIFLTINKTRKETVKEIKEELYENTIGGGLIDRVDIDRIFKELGFE